MCYFPLEHINILIIVAISELNILIYAIYTSHISIVVISESNIKNNWDVNIVTIFYKTDTETDVLKTHN